MNNRPTNGSRPSGFQLSAVAMTWSLWAAALAAPLAAAAEPSPCATSHKPLFYDNDFRYLTSPGPGPACLGDNFKQLSVADGEWGTMDMGGQFRSRYHHEEGMGQSQGLGRFQNTHTDFVLTRIRAYLDWHLNEWVRFYAEGIFADASDDSGNYVPRGIDRDYGDFLNLFADVALTDSLAVRVGRQELLYGDQRLVSPLDWANTRRTFEGARLLYRGEDWATDVFYTWLVPVKPNELNEADYDQTFYGIHGTYHGFEHVTLDTYYLGYDNQNTGGANGADDFSLHTLGVRINATLNDKWSTMFEGGPQFGRQSGLGLDHEAMFATCGFGRQMGDLLPWSPSLWFYYDYASGNNVGGDFNRFNHLFPLAHKYLGFIDAVQRSNIEAPNLLLTCQPGPKWKLLMWYWHFMANQDTDIVPAIGGTPLQSTASKDYGDELDVLLTYAICPRSQIVFGWSHLWRGDKILASTNDADFLYTEYTVDF
jgi:hypothetical protein